MNPTPKNNPAEDEINVIRLKLYEQTKGMSSKEQVEFFSSLAKAGFARHGITPRRAANQRCSQ